MAGEPTAEVNKNIIEQKPLDEFLLDFTDQLSNLLQERAGSDETGIADYVNEFWNRKGKIESSLKDDEHFFEIIWRLNHLMREINFFHNNYKRFPYDDVLVDGISTIYAHVLPEIDKNVDKIDAKGNFHNRSSCIDAVSYLGYENRQKAFDFVKKHKVALFEVAGDEDELFFYNTLSRLFINVNDRERQPILSELVQYQFEHGKTKQLLNIIYELMRDVNPLLGHILAGEVIGRYNLNSKEILEAWDKTSQPYDLALPPWKNGFLPVAYENNLETIIHLETEKPGATKYLMENFGIKCFGRYPTELLLKQFKNAQDQKPYGVILFPVNDHNGAFYGYRNTFTHLLQDLEDQYDLRVVEASNKFDIAKKLITFREVYQPKISFAIIGGHGTKDSIQFGRSYKESNNLITEDLMGHGIQKTSGFFENNPTIILSSCSTGKEKGIGHRLSETWGATVIAPDNDTAVDEIHAYVNRGPTVHFEIKFRDANAQAYVQGQTKETLPSANLAKKIED